MTADEPIIRCTPAGRPFATTPRGAGGNGRPSEEEFRIPHSSGLHQPGSPSGPRISSGPVSGSRGGRHAPATPHEPANPHLRPRCARGRPSRRIRRAHRMRAKFEGARTATRQSGVVPCPIPIFPRLRVSTSRFHSERPSHGNAVPTIPSCQGNGTSPGSSPGRRPVPHGETISPGGLRRRAHLPPAPLPRARIRPPAPRS